MADASRLRRMLLPAACFIVVAATAPVHGSLIITPSFDATITSNPNAAAMEAVINQAAGVYQSLFTDNVTATILFRYSATQPNGSPMGTFIGRSNYTLYSLAYNTYIAALIADAKTPNDAVAIANLPGSPLAQKVTASSADGRALGFSTPGAMAADSSVGTGGSFDGIVTLNSGQPIQFSRAGGISPGNYDALRFVEHEIDEVLGLGSILPATTDFSGSTAVRPEDLFRYSAPGIRSLTSSSTASSYFSINGGVTNIVGFNQNPSGDFGDWLSPSCSPLPPPLVQYAFSCAGQTADISAASPEGVALDVIGFDLASTAVPEPATMFLVGLSLLVAAAARRRIS